MIVPEDGIVVAFSCMSALRVLLAREKFGTGTSGTGL